MSILNPDQLETVNLHAKSVYPSHKREEWTRTEDWYGIRYFCPLLPFLYTFYSIINLFCRPGSRSESIGDEQTIICRHHELISCLGCFLLHILLATRSNGFFKHYQTKNDKNKFYLIQNANVTRISTSVRQWRLCYFLGCVITNKVLDSEAAFGVSMCQWIWEFIMATTSVSHVLPGIVY